MRAAVVMTNIRLSDVDLAVDPPRPLKDEERDILAFLLAEPFLGRDELREQLRTATVGAECVCGCRTVQFIVDESTPPIPEGTTLRVPVEAEAEDADGTPFWILLFIGNDHRAWMLEFVRFAESDRILRLPPVGEMRRKINELVE
jgi:hypothetical protein